jgi:hypothetical protein
VDPRRPEFYNSQGVKDFHLSILKPKVTGTARLRSSDPLEFPDVDLGFLTCKSDYQIGSIGAPVLHSALRPGNYEKANTPFILRKVAFPRVADGDDDHLDASMQTWRDEFVPLRLELSHGFRG